MPVTVYGYPTGVASWAVLRRECTECAGTRPYEQGVVPVMRRHEDSSHRLGPREPFLCSVANSGRLAPHPYLPFFPPRFAAAFIADFTAGGSPAVSVSGSATVPRQWANPFMPW